MISLAFALFTAAPVVAQTLSARPILLSIKDHRALVRVHADGAVVLADCPVPAGPAPNLSFVTPRTLASCVRSAVAIADTPAALAAFGDAFERAVHDWAGVPVDPAAIAARAAGVGAKYAAMTLLGNALALYVAYGGAPTPGGIHAGTRVGLAVSSAFGVVTGLVEFIDRRRDELARAGLRDVPAGRLANEAAEPVVLEISEEVYGTLRKLALDAFVETAAAGHGVARP